MLKGGGRGIFSNSGGISKIYNNLIIAEQSGYHGIDKVSEIQEINNHIIGPISTYGILVDQMICIKNNVVTGMQILELKVVENTKSSLFTIQQFLE